MHPRVLVLDEPTSALDPTAAEEVLATLTRLVHDLGVSVLMAEHRLERVVPFADRMLLLPGDGSVRAGAPADLLAVSPVVPPIVALGRALGWSPLPMTVRDARRLARELDLGDAPPSPPAPDAAPVLVGAHLTVVRGGTVAVREVDVELGPGRVTALMGRNGSGKSTLLWTLQGTHDRRAGSISVAGVDPARAPAAKRRDLVGLVPQTASDLLYLESVAEECAAADGGSGECRKLLDRLVPGVPDDSHPRDLSEGQRLALALAVVLVTTPPVLLLDDALSELDTVVGANVLREIQSAEQVFLTSPDPLAVNGAARWIVDAGEVAAA
jgi:energy-coupling factor transport system ATP-binding protein